MTRRSKQQQNVPEEKVAFVVAGYHKCGTSTLDKYLREIPGLSLPHLVKEVHFFSHYYDRGITWYHNQFKNPGLRGDVTPSYCEDPLFLERLAEYNTQMKIIIVMRNPADKLYAHYEHNVQNFNYQDSPDIYIQSRLENDSMMYLDSLEYVIQLFGREQVEIVIFEEMIQNPVGMLNEITRFLGVDWECSTFEEKHFNRPQIPKNPKLYSWLKTKSRKLYKHDHRWLVHLFKKLGFRKLLLTENNFTPMSEKTRQALNDKYRNEVRALSDLTGLDLLGIWKMQ